MSQTPSKEARKTILKDIIRGLHQGLSLTEAKERFEREVGDVTSTEIAEMEQSLITEGVSPDEIKKFCNVHALIFQSALEKATVKETSPAHPVYLFKLENRGIEALLDVIRKSIAAKGTSAPGALRDHTRQLLLRLRGVETHYDRKEQLLFPFLEKKGFMGPSKVMWGKDNEVRDMLKAALAGLDGIGSADDVPGYVDKMLSPLIEEVEGMIFKEENILLPTALELLAASDWVDILRESDDIGYVFIERPAETTELVKHLQAALLEETVVRDESVSLPTGAIKLKELMPILNTLPVDLTFVDRDDTVRYFSEGKDRTFLRTKAVLGRKVQNCHPPQSVDVVEKILASFKEGRREPYDFWINFKAKLVYIRYFPVRDSAGSYLGTLEVTQDVTGIRRLEGERRLLDERA